MLAGLIKGGRRGAESLWGRRITM